MHLVTRHFDMKGLLYSRQNILCDVIVVADDDNIQVPAHRAVLASCCQYFHAMFTSRLSESTSDRVVMLMIDGRALSILIDYIYTSEILITEENVQVCTEPSIYLNGYDS